MNLARQSFPPCSTSRRCLSTKVSSWLATPPSTPCFPCLPWSWTLMSQVCLIGTIFFPLDMNIFSGKTAITYPELYKELTKGRSLSYKTFFIWVLISIYQVIGEPSFCIPSAITGRCHHVWRFVALRGRVHPRGGDQLHGVDPHRVDDGDVYSYYPHHDMTNIVIVRWL